MARPGLSTHLKFRRLVRSLDSLILARGSLELLWDSCYEAGDDYLGTSDDIENLIGWTGGQGVLTQALVNAGAPERAGFIEPTTEGAATYRVHDLWQFAPDWAEQRYRQRRSRRRYRQAHPGIVRASHKQRRARVRLAEGTLSAHEWAALVEQFDGRCAYCGCDLVEATQDHVIPLSRGGRHDASNVVPACRTCNSRKGSRSAAEFRAAVR